MPQSYFLKDGYRSREEIEYFEDNLDIHQDVIHQPEVYPFVGYLARQFGCNTIIDLGCGQARKLVELHPEFNLIGIDFGKNISYCRANYNFGEWIDFDFESDQALPIDPEIIKRSIVVCSDVIEHMHNPDSLLKYIRYLLVDAVAGILTTPDRDALRGVDDMGPPKNPHHVREWSLEELQQYVQSQDIHVNFAGHTLNNDLKQQKTTSMLILAGKNQPDIVPAPSDFTVTAIMAAYNESDIIEETIQYLHRQGIRVYLIDNWSDDGTYEKASALKGQGLIGIEHYPAEKPSAHVYDWKNLLERIEQLTTTLESDWFIHYDVDELRESPWPNVTLCDALYYIDQMGFNAINHIRINFLPVDNRFEKSSNATMLDTFNYFQLMGKAGDLKLIKGWKNIGQQVSLADTGGHHAKFKEQRVFPYRFLIRHYPLRSKSQSATKVMARKQKSNWVERKFLGWHIMYDNWEPTDDQFFEKMCAKNMQRGTIFDETFYTDYLVERLSSIGIQRSKVPLVKTLRVAFTKYLVKVYKYIKHSLKR